MKKMPIFVLIFFAVLGVITEAAVPQAADSMTGTWRVTIENPPGDPATARIGTFVLKQEGEKFFEPIKVLWAGPM